MLLVGKAYDADWLRETVCFSPWLYCDRNVIERFFNKLEYSRRIVTGYDKLGSSLLAMINLAAIRLRLRVCESTA